METRCLRRLSRDESDIVSYIAEFGPISLSEARDILPEIPQRTLQRIISELVNDGYLKTDGNGPATKYKLIGEN
jgi:predicted HTH transcriptional regulator